MHYSYDSSIRIYETTILLKTPLLSKQKDIINKLLECQTYWKSLKINNNTNIVLNYKYNYHNIRIIIDDNTINYWNKISHFNNLYYFNIKINTQYNQIHHTFYGYYNTNDYSYYSIYDIKKMNEYKKGLKQYRYYFSRIFYLPPKIKEDIINNVLSK